MSNFVESEHPRDADGKFGSGGDGLLKNNKTIVESKKKEFESFEKNMKSLYGDGFYWKMTDKELEKYEEIKLSASKEAQNKKITSDKKNKIPEKDILKNNDKPIVLYHGTNEKFGDFDDAMIGSGTNSKSEGIWFTDDQRQAGAYGKNIKSVNISLKNPRIIDAMQDARDEAEKIGAPEPKNWEDASAILQYGNYFIDQIDEAKKSGNDGIIIRNVGDAPTHGQQLATQYLVFHAKQVQIVDDEKKSFIPHNSSKDSDSLGFDRSSAHKLDEDARARIKPAAGILFIAGGKILLTKRGSAAPDHAGEWALPGGHIETGETAEEAAIRECKEELDYAVVGPVNFVTEANGFTTYRNDCEVFQPQLNHESDGFVWAEPNALPSPMHPDAQSVINEFVIGRDGMVRTEMAVAKSIMAGDMPSPTRFGNFWIFAIRITGTGFAYRDKADEYVFRDPALYLNDEFLQRCSGLPVIWKHPKGDMLDSQEFEDRMVGTSCLAYVKGEDVWSVVKIYDEAAAMIMKDDITSTSPGVVFRKTDGNKEVELKGGETLLIEGKPSLLDHIAICEQGVWDKGGEPAGVISDSKGVLNMSDKETRADAEPDKLDKVVSMLDSLSKRMDAMESKKDSTEVRKDADDPDGPEKKEGSNEEKVGDAKKDEDDKARKDAMPNDPLMTAADKDSRKDGEDEEMEKKAEEKEVEAKALKKAADAATAKVADLERQLREVASQMPKQLSDADYSAMAEVQARADSVYSQFGDSASRPLNGEDVLAYRKRLALKLKPHSPQWKGIDISKLDATVFDIAETRIYADAAEAAMHPTDVASNTLREVTRRQRGGHEITEFYGSPEACWAPFKMPKMKGRINLRKD